MTTAEQLLASMTETDKTFVIDNDLRTIKIPTGVTNLGVQSDDDVLTVYFQMPGTYCGNDLSKFNIRINYLNAASEGDYHDVDDAVVQSDGTIRFSWTIGRHAASVVGNVEFNVCLKKTDSSGNVIREFNTTTASLPILKGLEVSEQVISEYNDILEQWRAKLFGVGDTEEARLLAVSQEQQQVISTKSIEVLSDIELKGQETLATIPDTYTEVYNMAEEAIRSKADAIVLETEGSIITVDDSSDDPLQNLKLYGQTAQLKTTGTQLFNPYAEQNNSFGNATVENNGAKITVTGNYYVSWPIVLKAGVQYFINFKASGNSEYRAVRFEYPDKEITGMITNPASFTPTKDTVSVYLYSGLDSQGTVIYENLHISEGSSAIPWEPYSGGVASPCPDYPQELMSVENATATVAGKNLLNHQGISKTMNGITFTVNEDKSIHVNGTATGAVSYYLRNPFTLPKGSYVLSGCPIGGGVGTYRIYYSDNVTKTVGNYGQPSNFTLDNSFTGMVVLQIYSGVTIDNLTFYPMIRHESFEDETYEPYVDPKTITLNRTLPGIPVASDGNYTDENGQQWICDEVDFDRGVYIQRTAIDELVTSTNYSDQGLYCRLSSGQSKYDVIAICSHSDKEIYYANGATGAYTTCVLGAKMLPETVTDLASGQAWLDAQKAAGTPVTVGYILTDPIETPLTSEEILAYKALKTNYPNTTVLNDSDAYMQVAYSADTLLFLRDHQKPPTDEQVTNAVNAYLDERGVQIPSDEYITNLMNGVITDAIGGSY